jgi:hypothetical protein
MDSTGANFHLLTSIGAGLFALSFIKGWAGHLLPSVWMAALAALTGIVGAVDGGALARPGWEPLVVIVAYLVLPLAGVLLSRKLYLSGQDGD